MEEEGKMKTPTAGHSKQQKPKQKGKKNKWEKKKEGRLQEAAIAKEIRVSSPERFKTSSPKKKQNKEKEVAFINKEKLEFEISPLGPGAQDVQSKEECNHMGNKENSNYKREESPEIEESCITNSNGSGNELENNERSNDEAGSNESRFDSKSVASSILNNKDTENDAQDISEDDSSIDTLKFELESEIEENCIADLNDMGNENESNLEKSDLEKNEKENYEKSNEQENYEKINGQENYERCNDEGSNESIFDRKTVVSSILENNVAENDAQNFSKYKESEIGESCIVESNDRRTELESNEKEKEDLVVDKEKLEFETTPLGPGAHEVQSIQECNDLANKEKSNCKKEEGIETVIKENCIENSNDWVNALEDNRQENNEQENYEKNNGQEIYERNNDEGNNESSFDEKASTSSILKNNDTENVAQNVSKCKESEVEEPFWRENHMESDENNLINNGSELDEDSVIESPGFGSERGSLISNDLEIDEEKSSAKQQTSNKRKKRKNRKNKGTGSNGFTDSSEQEPNEKYSRRDSPVTKQTLSPSSPSRPSSATDDPTIAPLNLELQRVLGRGRGIDGANNSCYMDSTLVSLFYCTDIFDEALLTQAGCKGHPNQITKSIRSILKDKIVYPLRQGHFCPRDQVWSLRNAMRTFNPKLCGSFMDAEEFMYHLFEDSLNANEFLHYTTGTSDYMHQILIDNSDSQKYPTLQHLFETSMKLLEDMKLQSVPKPALVLLMPRSDRLLVHYSGIVPNLQLDLNKVMVECDPDTSTAETEVALLRTSTEIAVRTTPVVPAAQSSLSSKFLTFAVASAGMLFANCLRSPRIPSIFRRGVGAILSTCVFIYALIDYPIPALSLDGLFQRIYNMRLTRRSPFRITNNEGSTTGIIGAKNDPEVGIGLDIPPKIPMDLIAVICIRGCHYTAFVKCGEELMSPWVYFDSMAGGGPEVEEVRDCGKWLYDLAEAPENVEKQWDTIPWQIKQMITDSHICIYKPSLTTSKVMNTSIIFENETSPIHK